NSSDQRNPDHRLSKLPAGTTGAPPESALLPAGAGAAAGCGAAGQGDCAAGAGCEPCASAVLTHAAPGFGRVAPFHEASPGLGAGLASLVASTVLVASLASALRRPISRAMRSIAPAFFFSADLVSAVLVSAGLVSVAEAFDENRLEKKPKGLLALWVSVVP